MKIAIKRLTASILFCLLVIPDFSIAYTVIIDEEGLEEKWFNKSLKSFSWDDILKVEHENIRRIVITLKDGKTIRFYASKIIMDYIFTRVTNG